MALAVAWRSGFFPGSPIWPRASSRRKVPYCRDAKRVPENGELPNSPKATVPFSWSPSIEPLNVSVKGMGSLIDIFHDKAGPSTTPSNISVEFPSAIWRPCNILPSALSESTPAAHPKVWLLQGPNRHPPSCPPNSLRPSKSAATEGPAAAERVPSLRRWVRRPNSESHLTSTGGAFINTDVGVARLRSWVEACDTHFVTAMTCG